MSEPSLPKRRRRKFVFVTDDDHARVVAKKHKRTVRVVRRGRGRPRKDAADRPARVTRRGRGRPRDDATDQLVVDIAAALKAFPLGPQQARDLALAWLEGQQASPTKLPRGARRKAAPHSDLVGYELPKSFEGRTETIRGKNLKPRPDVVSAFLELLRALVAKDMAALVRAFIHLKRAKPRGVGVAP